MYEYKVIPAPAKGRKARGVKGAEARFSHALELVMNEWAADGWEYQRSDVLPSEERQGLTSTQTVYRSVLVFRRQLETASDEASETDSELTEAEADDAPEVDTDETDQDAELDNSDTVDEEHLETPETEAEKA